MAAMEEPTSTVGRARGMSRRTRCRCRRTRRPDQRLIELIAADKLPGIAAVGRPEHADPAVDLRVPGCLARRIPDVAARWVDGEIPRRKARQIVGDGRPGFPAVQRSPDPSAGGTGVDRVAVDGQCLDPAAREADTAAWEPLVVVLGAVLGIFEVVRQRRELGPRSSEGWQRRRDHPGRLSDRPALRWLTGQPPGRWCQRGEDDADGRDELPRLLRLGASCMSPLPQVLGVTMREPGWKSVEASR